MRKTIFTIFALFSAIIVSAQTSVVNSEIFPLQTIANFFADSVKKNLGITYTIRKVYKCEDKSGRFFIVLTENNNDTLRNSIKAFNFHLEKAGLVKKWDINDFVVEQAISGEMEDSIWFWTNYVEVNDIDRDGWIDPVIVYGTTASNLIDDGRVKILIYYKGHKYVISHQNGVLDGERNTTVDKAFYSLPSKLQNRIKLIMQRMEDESIAIFPDGWKTAMKNHNTYFE